LIRESRSGTLHLTEDKSHPLHRFNWLKMHVGCMSQWKDLGTVYALLEDLHQSGSREGPALERLMDEMRPAMRSR
jgi:hypothetical protein